MAFDFIIYMPMATSNFGSSHIPVTQLTDKIGPPSARQRNAIQMVFRCSANGGSRLSAGWKVPRRCWNKIISQRCLSVNLFLIARECNLKLHSLAMERNKFCFALCLVLAFDFINCMPNIWTTFNVDHSHIPVTPWGILE